MAYPYVSDRETRVISKHFGDPQARTLINRKVGDVLALKQDPALGDAVPTQPHDGHQRRGFA